MLNDIANNYYWQQIIVLPGAQIPWWAEVLRSLIRLVMGVAGTLLCVPVLVWYERRLLGWMQGRLGPNRVGPFGLLQPIADAMKLMFKEDIIPTNVDRALYIIAPGVALLPVVLSITVLPWNSSPEWGAVAPGLDVGILFLLAVASIEVYGVILAGWSSNNKYSLLGGLRASSQVISYELGMGLSIISVLLISGTLNTQALVAHQGDLMTQAVGVSGYSFPVHAISSGIWDWHMFALFPFGFIAMIVYGISMIAETNRAPFDLPEAETELVAGFHTEYSSFKFAMFFMGEYANMVIVSSIFIMLFWGGWLAPWGGLSQLDPSIWDHFQPWLLDLINTGIGLFWFALKLVLLLSFFIWVRATFPRLRYDMLMKFGWKALLPIALVNLLLIAASFAFQQQYGTLVGQGIAVGIGVAILLVLFIVKYVGYQKRKRAARAADILPIRRESVITPTAAAVPSEAL